MKLTNKQSEKYLKSDRGQWCTHASVESSRPFFADDIAKDAEGRTGVGLLLLDSERIKRVTRNYTCHASKASSNKLRPEIHYTYTLFLGRRCTVILSKKQAYKQGHAPSKLQTHYTRNSVQWKPKSSFAKKSYPLYSLLRVSASISFAYKDCNALIFSLFFKR